ncbi:PEP-CTERM sorting domain-containing protein [Tundrisphaera sp. TA3]|uniref:PEP-CTERM sorting domain-containing protein n=1 Tax=Tundrisphaera sp. TA3 TaxID=3435775 RepID=UPI003EBE34D2
MAATNRIALYLCLLGCVGRPAFGGAINPVQGTATPETPPTPGEPRLAVSSATEAMLNPRTDGGTIAAKPGPPRNELRFNYRPVGVAPIDESEESRGNKPADSAPAASTSTPPTITSTPSAPSTSHASSTDPAVATKAGEALKVDGHLELAVTSGGSPLASPSANSNPASSSSASSPSHFSPLNSSSATPSTSTTTSGLFASPNATSGHSLSSNPTATAATNAAALASRSAAASAPTAPTEVADAYLNFGSGPYAEAKTLTTGDAKPWYTSPVVSRAYGGSTPDAKDRASFESKVVSTVEKTYEKAGVPVRLTTDPSVDAAHMLSVVANTQATANPNAIGIASVGFNGFTFVDKFTESRSPDDLATAIGHNVAHELMHTFGIADHPETTGDAVDAATASWSSLNDPNASFSQSAANQLSTLNFRATDDLLASSAGTQPIVESGQEAMPAPVPEPSTVALWALAGTLGIVLRRRARASAR